MVAYLVVEGNLEMASILTFYDELYHVHSPRTDLHGTAGDVMTAIDRCDFR
jgi:hypothetical protein